MVTMIDREEMEVQSSSWLVKNHWNCGVYNYYYH